MAIKTLKGYSPGYDMPFEIANQENLSDVCSPVDGVLRRVYLRNQAFENTFGVITERMGAFNFYDNENEPTALLPKTGLIAVVGVFAASLEVKGGQRQLPIDESRRVGKVFAQTQKALSGLAYRELITPSKYRPNYRKTVGMADFALRAAKEARRPFTPLVAIAPGSVLLGGHVAIGDADDRAIGAGVFLSREFLGRIRASIYNVPRENSKLFWTGPTARPGESREEAHARFNSDKARLGQMSEIVKSKTGLARERFVREVGLYTLAIEIDAEVQRLSKQDAETQAPAA
ncbi:MAG TPA: hypothetical protein VH234_02640 [Candidatus Saccharimonadales bacterium]|jgi:hypothetical protein|nr:hypothetical protein [Candidatus Saccharimonadales bacterium]